MADGLLSSCQVDFRKEEKEQRTNEEHSSLRSVGARPPLFSFEELRLARSAGTD